MLKPAFLSVICLMGISAYSAVFEASAWRGETAYVKIPEALQDDALGLSSDAAGEGVSFTLLRFDEVKYDTFERYTDKEGKKKARVTGKGKVADVCREWKKGDKTFPTMLKVTVAPDAKPGKRTVKLGESNFFDLTVVNRVLPPAKDWKYFLDLWQHPWAVSRYFNVKPFSKEHYAKMEPVWRALAESGCKALTVTLLDLPWNNQCLDGYYSMIGRVRKADGKWEFDYTVFDEYVEFGRKCGLGPDIACYTMCPWGYMVSWKEEGMGNGLVERREKYLPGTAEFEDYWGDFLVDFKKHLEAKGWFNDAYIAMDERAPDDVRKIIAFIQKKAPGMKVAMAGNKSPSEFSGMNIDNYCQGLIHLRKHPKLLDELEPRRQKGFKTTFYVCATAMHPNTFMDSPADEGFWLGAYPGITGFDGFLRWAANSWPKDPYDDASFKTVRRGNLHWRPGDTFLIYPRGELSSRLISLRAGVVAAEKMRILKEGERESVEKALKKLGEPYGYKGAVNNAFDFSAFRRAVDEFVNKAVIPAASANEIKETKTFSAVSPDGLNEVRLELSESKGLQYSVLRRGKILVETTELALKVGLSWLNGREVYLLNRKVEAEARKVEGTLATPIYKKSFIDLAANEIKVDFGDWAVRLHARNDGVAWRFETEMEGEITVRGEDTTVRFTKGTELCYTMARGLMSGWEKPAVIGPVESVSPGHPQIVMTPFTATVPGAGVVTVTESDLRDYPGLNFYRHEGETDTLRSWQAGVPKELDGNRRRVKVKTREPYLAKTKGARAFPWRVFVLADTPSGLVESDIVYALAEPNRIGDASWVKPGQVAWDWWNGRRITDVPGLKSGCNYETYKAYIDFAAANGIAYVILDEGWAEKLNLDKPRDEVNVPGVVEYGKSKGVGIILWAAWPSLIDSQARERIFDRYAGMGVKGFKVDFIERDDQIAERFLEETAMDAAKRKLVILYHGIHKPTGLQRTYPNILNYEGVYGLEQGGDKGGKKEVVANDVNLIYSRMVAGFMDYTPGAMRNRAFNAPEFDKTKEPFAAYGTRCHQLALFPMFEAPIQMLADSPTQYRTEPECAAFLTKVPVVWDETVGVAGEINKFAVVARKKGTGNGELVWWLGAITNWEAREIEIPTSFLGSGEWKVEAFEDAPDSDKNAEHYVRRVFTIKAGDKIKVRLAPGGGYAARFVSR